MIILFEFLLKYCINYFLQYQIPKRNNFFFFFKSKIYLSSCFWKFHLMVIWPHLCTRGRAEHPDEEGQVE